MTITFERPIGAHRDINELQYLSALHQTGNNLRPDATITDKDVVRFLLSRHGLKADLDFVKENLMPGLAGALGDSPAAVFDIVEIVSILLIPYLKKASASVDDDDNIFSKVLTMILKDSTASTDTPILDRAAMQNILETYGEFDVPPVVIDEMLLAAGALQEPTRLSAALLMKACTDDIAKYNNDWDETATTHFDDVFQGTTLDVEVIAGSSKNQNTDGSKELDDEEVNKSKSKFDEGQQVKRVYTAASVDGIAENYSSKAFVAIVWFLVVMLYFSYVINLNSFLGALDCSKFNNDFACKVVNSIVAWLLIFVQLSILGFLFVFMTSAGNSIYATRSIGDFLYLLVGIATVVCTTILSNIFQFRFLIINTTRPDETLWTAAKEFQSYSIVVLGAFLLLFQLKALFFLVVPKSTVSTGKLSFFSKLLVPGMAKAEKATKQSASFKTAKMVTDAIALHDGTLAGSSLRTSKNRNVTNTDNTEAKGFGDALLNFHATVDDRERYGGVLWCWKGMWKGTIVAEEGIWIHSRIYAINAAQIFVGVLFIILMVVFYTVVVSLYEPSSSSPSDYSSTPTSSPTTIDDGAINSAYSLSIYMNQVISEYLVQQSKYENFSSYLWLYFVNETFATEFAESLLNSLPDQLLEYTVQNLDSDTLQLLQQDVVLGIQNTSFVNTTGRLLIESTSHRNLQSTTTSPTSAASQQGETTTSPTSAPSQQGETTDWTPARWQGYLAVFLGGLTAFCAAISLFAIWIPSVVATVLQFRSGVIGSLRDPEFRRYRAAPDLTGVLFGAAFWGSLFASGSLFFMVGTVVFLAVYQITRPYFIQVLAQLIGILVTVGVKVIILMSLRKILFKGFYRKSPAFANCMMVCMECWNLALTVLSMLQRLVKLMLVTGFYVGRLDTPMLAKGVGNIGPVPLDDFPIQFRKDLLLHDAHRHPYMERLGVMYMLKLRYGDDFATRAGSAWRLIFVMALMPWLRRFRVNEDEGDEEIVTPEQKAIDRVNAKRLLMTHKFGPKRFMSSNDIIDADDYENNDDNGGEVTDGEELKVDEKEKLKNEVNLLKQKLLSIKEYLKSNGSDIVDSIVWELT